MRWQLIFLLIWYIDDGSFLFIVVSFTIPSSFCIHHLFWFTIFLLSHYKLITLNPHLSSSLSFNNLLTQLIRKLRCRLSTLDLSRCHQRELSGPTGSIWPSWKFTIFLKENDRPLVIHPLSRRIFLFLSRCVLRIEKALRMPWYDSDLFSPFLKRARERERVDLCPSVLAKSLPLPRSFWGRLSYPRSGSYHMDCLWVSKSLVPWFTRGHLCASRTGLLNRI